MNKILLDVVIKLVIAAVVPFLFIWSVNTLFNTGILLTFKTWLAGFVLIQIFNFYARRVEGRYHPKEYEHEEDYGDEYEDEEYEEVPDDEPRERVRETLKVHQGRKNRKGDHPRKDKS